MYSSRKSTETTSNNDPIRRRKIRKSKEENQNNKNRTKRRSFAKALSAPIRKLYKRSRTSNEKNKKEKTSAQRLEQLVEHRQHLITPAHTFDTQEVVISPRSVDSLTVGDSSSHFQEDRKEYRILLTEEGQNIRDDDKEQEWTLRPTRAFDMDEVLSSRSFESLKIGNSSSYIQEDEERYQIQIEQDEQRNSVYDGQLEGQDIVCCTIESSQLQTQPELDLEANLNECGEQHMYPDNQLNITENEESSMSTTDEVDSLMPTMDYSLYFDDDDEDGDDDDDSYHPPPHQYPNEAMTSATVAVAAPPVKFLDISISYGMDIEGEEKQKDPHEEEVVSVTSSYNSYLQAIENITASTSDNVEKVVEAAMDKVDTTTLKEIDVENCGELDKYYVSFTPSNEMYLQAMEGASAKAQLDIERATALALSKINTAAVSIASCKDDGKSKTASKVANAAGYSHDRVLGFLFLIFLVLGLSGNSHQFLENIRSISNHAVWDKYPTQQDNVVRTIPEEEYMQLSIWVENQIAGSASNGVSKEDKSVHNVVCALFSSLFGPWLYFN